MTLLIRIAAPLQSWGSESKFRTRKTEREPTKSGIVGLCACALGRKRTDDISDLANLRFGVRTIKEGKLLIDFQTAKSKTDAFISYRHYLADAEFVVGLEGDEALLQEIESALSKPAFPLFLGRKSCPPTLLLSLGFIKLPLSEALKEGSRPNERILMDAETASMITRKDTPKSFSQTHRQYETRDIKEI